jgi:light-regulated signal transduction histidine kinase (bacteriophytochrome)
MPPASPAPPEFGRADLTNCEAEPIHLPESIQSHGILLALREPDLAIERVSENAARWFGVPAAALLGTPLVHWVDPRRLEAFRRETAPSSNLDPSAAASLHEVNPLRLVVNGAHGPHTFDAIVHRASGLLILELEPCLDPAESPFEVFCRQARRSVLRLERASSSRELWDLIVREIQAITGFDRVMVYRFHPDQHGEVVSEVKASGLEPCLGLHYPASDIPSQARALYVRNWLRLIVDVDDRPARILSQPGQTEALDLSFSTLRTVSPIHIQYMRNMGVASSMSISILKGNDLWGLVACHHRTAKYVPYQARSVCEFIGQVLSWQIALMDRSERATEQLSAKLEESQIIAAMSEAENLSDGLLQVGPALMDLVAADGVAICHDGRCELLGATPSAAEVQQLVGWLWPQLVDGLFHTQELSATYPRGNDLKEVASGVLALSLPDEVGAALVWFRRETLQTINWGGDPNKPYEVTANGTVYTARRSFALWRQVVSRRSLAWTESQVRAARDLADAILHVVVSRAIELRKLNAELHEAIRARDDFLSTASHELRTPLTTLQLQVCSVLDLVRASLPTAENQLACEKVARKLDVAWRQVARLESLVETLLDVSRISAGRLVMDVQPQVALSQVATEVVERTREQARSAGCELVTAIAQDIVGKWDAIRLDQVLTNLLSNALKYGAGRPIELSLTADEANAYVEVADHGIGIDPADHERIFQRFQRAVSDRHYAGFGLGLWIVRRIVGAMGGSISLDSRLGHGARFRVVLPRVHRPTSPRGHEVP